MRPSRKNFVALVLALDLVLSGCSASLKSSDVKQPAPDGRVLRSDSGPLAGTVDSKEWKMGKAIARLGDGGEYNITIAGEGVDITCGNFFPLAPHLSFIVPRTPGSYAYDSASGQGGRLLNVIFPYTTANGGGSDNVLATKSLIQIDTVAVDRVDGRVSGLSPQGDEHSYDLSGTFSAEVCGAALEKPLVTKIKGVTAFAIAYAEALRFSTNNGGVEYEVRLMNKVPSRKCDTFSGWMMTETPIKYVTVRSSSSVGDLPIRTGTVVYGDQGNSSGWSTEYFSGRGRLKSLTGSEIEVAVDVQDVGDDDITVAGFIKTRICN